MPQCSKTTFYIAMIAATFWVACLGVLPASATQNSLILKSPNGQYVIVLSAPFKRRFIGEVWQKIDVKYNNGKLSNVENLVKNKSTCGYAPAKGRKQLWSPDGKYAVFYHYGKSSYRKDGVFFLELPTASWIKFQTDKGIVATLHNYNGGWLGGKPHSLFVLEHQVEIVELDAHGRTKHTEATPQKHK